MLCSHEWVPDKQNSGLEVFLDAARDVSNEPHAICLLLDSLIVLEGKSNDRLGIEVFKPEMGITPAGKTAIKVEFCSSYQYWKEFRADTAKYDAEKKLVADLVIAGLEGRFPGLKGRIEAVDVMTPVTSERYLGAYRGLQAWTPNIGLGKLMEQGVSNTIPGLDNFYMVGQYAFGTVGLMTAAVGAHNLVKGICKAEGRRFLTEVAK